jgi:glucokinase
MARHPTAQDVILAAKAGNETAVAILRLSGEKLGAALAVIIDVINPEKIVLGTLYRVARAYLEPSMRRILEGEALPGSLSACQIVPAKLGKNLGNYGAVCAALYESNEWN